jgi:hypothetical protein
MTWRKSCLIYLGREARHAYHRLNELTMYESVKGFTQILSDDMDDTEHEVLRNPMVTQKDKF